MSESIIIIAFLGYFLILARSRCIRQAPSDLARAVLGKDFDAFGEWAFGLNCDNLIYKDLMHRWNERHSDLLILESSGNPYKDIPKMIHIWYSKVKNLS